MEKNIYTLMAGLLEYPQEDIKLRLEETIKAVAADPDIPPVTVDELKRFQKDLEEIPLGDLQGIFSYTFELSGDYTMDMGYHLYDGFKRSNSLSTIKAMYRDKGFPFEQVAKGELPDYLPVLLYFLGFIKDEELKKNFRESFVVLAMEKLKKNFEKNRKNIYHHLISAIYRVIEKDVKGGKING